MNAMSAIQRQLRERFNRPGEAGRIVIWSDPEGRYADSLNDLSLPDVAVLRVEDNEFAVKRRVLLAEPKPKFLLYRHRQPDTPETVTDNWLKDMELAYGMLPPSPPPWPPSCWAPRSARWRRSGGHC